MSTIIGVLILTAIALAALGWIAWKVRGTLRVEEVDSGWWEDFTAEKYRPLEHLLDGAELDYLRMQPGCDRKLLRRFRAERAKICLGFLGEMKSDFQRLQAVGQALVIADRCSADFHEELFRHRVRFSLAWWRVRMGLLAWRLGLPEPDAAALVDALEVSAGRVRLAVAPVV